MLIVDSGTGPCYRARRAAGAMTGWYAEPNLNDDAGSENLVRDEIV